MTESTLIQNARQFGSFSAIGTPDTIDTTNGNRILVGPHQKILLLVHLSTSSNNDTVKVLAGANPPAFRGGIGDYTYTSTGGAKELYMLLDTGRFADDDGYIHLTFPTHTSLAGTLEAYGV
jgi:hypothetical protein